LHVSQQLQNVNTDIEKREKKEEEKRDKKGLCRRELSARGRAKKEIKMR